MAPDQARAPHETGFASVAPHGHAVPAQQLSDQVLTLPNLLSFLRLVGVPLFLWLVLTDRTGWAVAVLMVSGVTDFLDGALARRFGQVTRVGALLDPLADRLYVFSTLFGLAWTDVVPWWLAGLLVARDALLTATLPVLRAHRLPPLEVTYLGKAATLALLMGLPLLLLGSIDGPVGGASLVLGWALTVWGTALYLWTAGWYVVRVGVLVRWRRQVDAGAAGVPGTGAAGS